MIRLRVEAYYSNLNGWCWGYNVFDTAMPEDQQSLVTGGWWYKWEPAFEYGLIQLQACIERRRRDVNYIA